MPVPHPAPLSGASYSAAELLPSDDRLLLLDQRRLPLEELYVELSTCDQVTTAIRDMVVRGAPAIGVTAAYALVLAAVEARSDGQFEFVERMKANASRLAAARPTAVNLRWAVERMMGQVPKIASGSGIDRVSQLAELARTIHRDDVEACRRMGKIGAAHLPDEGTVLTHCNAGALATGGYGTALGVIRAAREAGKRIRVLSCETRPYLQGARLTCWELSRDGVPVELITDSMSAHFFARGEIDAVVVGADRVARNGDVANKIGTYAHACLAHLHGRPFYVAAPLSTLDPSCPSGPSIPIEERSSEEVVRIRDVQLAPREVHARHPGFDVTPARYVTRLITEAGDVAGPDAAQLMRTAAN